MASSATTYQGLQILELTTTIAGPFAAMILADLGADVIKIERPSGDDARHMPPHRGSESAVFHAVNRNKRSVVLDLKDPRALEAFLGLVAMSDVVIQSFRPGVAERLGVGYDAIRRRNPRTIYCSVSAFGTDEGSGLPGYDPLIQAFTGIMSMTGQPDGEPVRVAPSLIDLTTGMWATIAIMAALQRREVNGEGEHVEVAMVDAGYALLCHQIVGMFATGVAPAALGSASPITAPYENFMATDGWVLIAAGNDKLFAKLCAELGVPHLPDDPRFTVSSLRVRHRQELHNILQERIGVMSTSECIDRLRRAGVPVGPVQTLRQALEHDVAIRRGIVTLPQVFDTDSLPMVKLPIDDSGSPRVRPPYLGEHTAEVLIGAGIPGNVIGHLLPPQPQCTRQEK